MTVARQFGWIGLALALAPASVAAAPAPEPCALCGLTPGETASNGEPAPLMIELETSLDFDRLVLGGSGSGSVRLAPDGSSSVSGSVDSISGRARIGRFVIQGEPGRQLHVDLPRSIELVGIKGTVVRVSTLITNLPDAPALDSNGRLAVDFGGELEVDGGSDGEFRGQLLIRADYL